MNHADHHEDESIPVGDLTAFDARVAVDADAGELHIAVADLAADMTVHLRVPPEYARMMARLLDMGASMADQMERAKVDTAEQEGGAHACTDCQVRTEEQGETDIVDAIFAPPAAE